MAKAGALLAVAGVIASLAGVAASQGADGKGVRKVRFGGDLRQTRVVLELDASAKGRVIQDGSGGTFVLALAGAGVAGDLDGKGLGLVKAWEVERGATGAKLRLDLMAPATVKRRFLLPPTDGIPVYRYVVDLEATGSTAPARAAAPVVTRTGHTQARAKKIIVIDAGHGGKDPGTRGARVVEKDVTLAAARSLKDRLEKTGRYKVVLTRSADAFVPKTSRVQIARRADADLFISLHADAGTEPGLRGASVYTLSDSGLERTAKKIIAPSGYFMNVDLPGRDRSVNAILLDLTQRATKNQSSRFAETLVERIGEKNHLLRRSHRSAGFVVLFAPDVPAVLLEMGFLTNAEDEALLADKRRRGRMMEAVAASIDAYFDRDAPTSRS